MIKQPTRKKTNRNTKKVPKKKHKKYGVSDLERYFANTFLTPLKLDFVYEYEVKEIGRFYDFAIVAVDKNTKIINEEYNNIVFISQSKNIVRPLFFVEVDGDYW